MNFSSLDWIILVLYLAGMIAIGLYFSKQQTSTEEFFLGGRRFGAFAMSLSILATGLSAISFLGVPGFVVDHDWSTFLASLMGLPATLVVAWFLLPFFYNLKLTSSYDYLQRRFDTKVAALAGIMFFALRGLIAGIAIYAPSIALCAVTGWNLNLCIVISGIMTIIYTTLGGMSAVVWTDIIQVVVLFGGVGLVLVKLSTQLAGTPADWWVQASELNKFNILNFHFSWTELTFWGSVIGGIFYNVAFYGVDQVLVQRYMCANSLPAARKSLYWNAAYTLPSSIVFFIVGTLLFLYMRQAHGEFPPGTSGQQVFPLYLLHHLPRGMPGLMVAAIYAAAMSTLSSVLNSLATVSVNDFYKRFWKTDATEAHYVKISQRLTVAWGVLALFVALGSIHLNSNVWLGAVKAGSLFMGPMLGMFILGMGSKCATSNAAFFSCVIGSTVSVVIGYGTPLELFWLTMIGTIITGVIGLALTLIFPATVEAQRAALPYTWMGDRARAARRT